MGPRITVMRTAIRGILAFMSIIALVIALRFLLTELNTDNPNPALTALLGTITGGLAAFLGTIGNAIAQNPSDRGANGD